LTWPARGVHIASAMKQHTRYPRPTILSHSVLQVVSGGLNNTFVPSQAAKKTSGENSSTNSR